MDVLEHLENFHLIAAEMVRCADKYVLVSLPNSAAEVPNILLRPEKMQLNNYQGYFSKYYGIPLKRELDRHRYWMYPQDIIRYFENLALKYELKIAYVLPNFSYKLKFLRLILGRRIFYTFFLTHVCVLLSKKN